MPKKSLDEIADDIMTEQNPQADAVNALIKSEPRVSGEPSDIELKTDLINLDQVNLHTALDVLGNILEMAPKDFNASVILSSIIHRRERKLLSLQRRSRTEIVNVAKNPDLPQENMPQEGFLKRFFTSRKQPIQ